MMQILCSRIRKKPRSKRRIRRQSSGRPKLAQQLFKSISKDIGMLFTRERSNTAGDNTNNKNMKNKMNRSESSLTVGEIIKIIIIVLNIRREIRRRIMDSRN